MEGAEQVGRLDNSGPAWAGEVAGSAWGVVERYGWLILGVLVAVWLVGPAVKARIAAISDALTARSPEREAEWSRRARDARARQQEREAAASRQWAEGEPERRAAVAAARLREMQERSGGAGMQFRGKGRRLGSEPSQDSEGDYASPPACAPPSPPPPPAPRTSSLPRPPPRSGHNPLGRSSNVHGFAPSGSMRSAPFRRRG
eukprot:jgi/Chlat1/6294/Chrsp44S05871